MNRPDAMDYAVFEATTLVPGHAHGRAIALAPLSFWGGYDAHAGKIVDRTHAGAGENLAGRVMVMPRARGSSSSSSVLAEALRHGTGPAAIVLTERDLILSIGAIVANEMYAMTVPVVMVTEDVFATLSDDALTLGIDAQDADRPATVRVIDHT